MKNITQSIVFLALVFTAVFVHAAPPKISIALPSEALTIDDLDARDSLNRPISRSASQVKLVELFSRTLNRMLLQSLTPLKLRTLALLNSSWDGFAGALRAARRVVWEKVSCWIAEKKSPIKFISIISSTAALAPPVSWPVHASGNSFFFFIHSVISSTRLLR